MHVRWGNRSWDLGWTPSGNSVSMASSVFGSTVGNFSPFDWDRDEEVTPITAPTPFDEPMEDEQELPDMTEEDWARYLGFRSLKQYRRAMGKE